MAGLQRRIDHIEPPAIEHQVVQRKPRASALGLRIRTCKPRQNVVDVVLALAKMCQDCCRLVHHQGVGDWCPPEQGLQFHVYLNAPDVQLGRLPGRRRRACYCNSGDGDVVQSQFK